MFFSLNFLVSSLSFYLFIPSSFPGLLGDFLLISTPFPIFEIARWTLFSIVAISAGSIFFLPSNDYLASCKSPLKSICTLPYS